MERVGQENREIEFCTAEALRKIEKPFSGFFLGFAAAIGDELVSGGQAGVDRLHVSLHHVSDMCFGIKLADGPECWGGHDGVADPTGLDDEDFLGCGRHLGEQYSGGELGCESTDW